MMLQYVVSSVHGVMSYALSRMLQYVGVTNTALSRMLQ
jgi:hypothetical protein